MISSGRARAKFRECVELQGGDSRVVDEPSRLPQARLGTEVTSSSSGFIIGINCENLGIAIAVLGGGRETKEHHIDHGVGLEFHSRIGDRVEKGQPLVTIHYNADGKLAEAAALIATSYQITAEPPRNLP